MRGQDLAHHVVAERRVERRPGVDEGVERVVLVAVHDAHPLGTLAGVEHEVAGHGDVVGTEPRDEHADGVAVPRQLAVVVAGQHDHAVVGAIGEPAHGGDELRVGVEDGPDVGRAGEHLEAVAGDDEQALALDRLQRRRQRRRGPGRSDRGDVAEVDVADDHDVSAARHGDLDEVGDHR